MKKTTVHAIPLSLLLLTGVPSHRFSTSSSKAMPLAQTCERTLVQKIAHSSIKRRIYHIAQMQAPCKQLLLGNALSNKVPGKKKLKTSNPYALKQLDSKYASWGVDPVFSDAWINLVEAWKIFEKKREVVVAVIDTGIDPKHEYLAKNIYVVEGIRGLSNFGKDFSLGNKKSQRAPSSRAPIDDHGHGTHVAGILKSVFPEVKILPIKYFNPKRTGQENLQSLIRSLQYAIEAKVDIINYSGGGPEPAVEELEILKKAERQGILVIAAAGNEQSNIDRKDKAFYPASYGLSNIITVTAHDQQAAILKSSNWGEKSVELSAPGHRIRSSVPHNQANIMTGTSQATAFVSGVVAMIKAQYPKLSAQDIKFIIRRSTKKIGTLAKKSVTGGKLDAAQALAIAKTYHQKQQGRASKQVLGRAF